MNQGGGHDCVSGMLIYCNKSSLLYKRSLAKTKKNIVCITLVLQVFQNTISTGYMHTIVTDNTFDQHAVLQAKSWKSRPSIKSSRGISTISTTVSDFVCKVFWVLKAAQSPRQIDTGSGIIKLSILNCLNFPSLTSWCIQERSVLRLASYTTYEPLMG